MNTRIVYRIEIPNKNGMWYNMNGEFEPTIQLFCPNGVAKDFPMPFNELHKRDGRVWNSAGKSIENMNQWFTREDVLGLVSNGFKLFEFEITEWQELEMEILFTRGGVLRQREIPIEDVWPETLIEEQI